MPVAAVSYPASVTANVALDPSTATDGATAPIDVAWMYARAVTVAAAPMNGPGMPDGDVTRTYTYHVPGAIVTETVAAFETSDPVPHATRPAALVMPALAA